MRMNVRAPLRGGVVAATANAKFSEKPHLVVFQLCAF